MGCSFDNIAGNQNNITHQYSSKFSKTSFGMVPNNIKTKNPTKFILEELTYDQQEELFLMNIYGQKNSDALIKAMLNGDMEKAMQLYAKFHHTKDNVVNDRIVKQKFKKAYK